MDDLVAKLRAGAEPFGKLLDEAADALAARDAHIAQLTESLRAMIEISNSQRLWDFAEVKRTVARARELLASATRAPPTQPAGREASAQEDQVVSGVFKEITDLLKHPG